jgi:ABC-2 type transport system ATP-binding protein
MKRREAKATLREEILEIRQLCKSFRKNVFVNDNVDITIGKGEIFGLLGPNGAGKTTLVSQIIGLTIPDSGAIKIHGIDVIRNPKYARTACSFQSQTQVPISGLTPLQAIELVGRVRGGTATNIRQRANNLLASLEMGEWTTKSAETLSGGMRRLVAFCMAAVVPGEVVILDEPTNDIDPLRRRLLWKEVRNLVNSGSSVLLVTHNILEAERAVDRLAIMDSGKVVATGTPASLKQNGNRTMRLEIVLEPDVALNDLPALLGTPIRSGRRILARVKETDVIEAIDWARGMKERGELEEYSVGPTTLEDVYLQLVGYKDEQEISSPEASR